MTALVGASAAIRAIEQEVESAAQSDAKVLITGETGVGKEIVARLVHEKSRRNQRPFVTINCAGVPDSLLESELFGHLRGSFTDAFRDRRGWLDRAHGGAVFMDEVGEMSLRMQALLLRFLENGEIQRVGSDGAQVAVDVRVIAATNRNLVDRIAERSFREDLYYRLNVIHVVIPPLRQRREDVPLLFNHFLKTQCALQRVPEPRVSPEALVRLVAYDWPGNVRELKNVVERLMSREHSGAISEADLPHEISGPGPALSSVEGESDASRRTSDVLFARICERGESFWSVAYDPFMSRDLTRDDLRALVSHGLQKTRGSYRELVSLFNLDARDYKRLLSFLRKYECHIPFQRFRADPVGVTEFHGHRSESLAEGRRRSGN
jgi:DNA-binding NtrC family response regulator